MCRPPELNGHWTRLNTCADHLHWTGIEHVWTRVQTTCTELALNTFEHVCIPPALNWHWTRLNTCADHLNWTGIKHVWTVHKDWTRLNTYADHLHWTLIEHVWIVCRRPALNTQWTRLSSMQTTCTEQALSTLERVCMRQPQWWRISCPTQVYCSSKNNSVLRQSINMLKCLSEHGHNYTFTSSLGTGYNYNYNTVLTIKVILFSYYSNRTAVKGWCDACYYRPKTSPQKEGEISPPICGYFIIFTNYYFMRDSAWIKYWLLHYANKWYVCKITYEIYLMTWH